MIICFPKAILTSTPTDLTITWLMGNAHVKLVSHENLNFGVRFTSCEHLYSPGSTHIYAYWPDYYMGNTHVKLVPHKMFQHFGARFTPHMNICFPKAILTSTPTDITITWVMGNTHVKLVSHENLNFGVRFTSCEHLYSPGSTHIYAYGPNY